MITLDGSTLASFGLVAQPGHEHGIPQTVDRIVTIPNRDGAYDFGSDIGPREFTIPLAWATETSRENLQAKIRTFSSFLTNAQGKPRDMVLVFDYEPDKFYTTRYSGKVSIERLFSMGFLVLPLIAFDPYAYGDEQINETTFTDSPHTENIESVGSVVTPLVIVLKNTGINVISGFTIKNEYLVEE